MIEPAVADSSRSASVLLGKELLAADLWVPRLNSRLRGSHAVHQTGSASIEVGCGGKRFVQGQPPGLDLRTDLNPGTGREVIGDARALPLIDESVDTASIVAAPYDISEQHTEFLPMHRIGPMQIRLCAASWRPSPTW